MPVLPLPAAVVSEPGSRPLLRGVLHQIAFSASLVVDTLLIVGAEGARRHVAASVFAGSGAACLGASALCHRVTYAPGVGMLEAIALNGGSEDIQLSTIEHNQ